VRDQLQRVKPELQKQFHIQTCRAFDRVVLSGGVSYPIEEQFQVPDEQMLQKAQGQSCLRRFLESKGLIYQPGDALDTARFLKDVLPGTTPLPDKPEVYTARAVHERFLGAPGLRLLPDVSVVRQTVLRSVADGKVVVRFQDTRVYDARGCVEGPDGQRRRVGGSLTTFPLEDNVYVTRVDSTYGMLWVKEDAPTYGGGQGKGGQPTPPPPPQGRVMATTWDKIVELAAERPLVELHLRASKPAAAAALMALAQPLGADTLSLTVTVSGSLRDGGTLNFAASGVKPTHPTKPLAIAQTLFNALGEGAEYEADLELGFGAAGRNGLETQLRALAEERPDGVTPQATFEKPVAVAR
jgi:hypothetical protein